MNIEQKEALAAERVIQSAYGQVMKYSKPEDLEAAIIALLWAAFEMEAKRTGLSEWRGLELN
jgi:hypothetical protein